MTREQNLYLHLYRLVESIEYYLVHKDSYCLDDVMMDLKQSKDLLFNERELNNEEI